MLRFTGIRRLTGVVVAIASLCAVSFGCAPSSARVDGTRFPEPLPATATSRIADAVPASSAPALPLTPSALKRRISVPERFDASRARAEMVSLAAIGPRPEGGRNETAAAKHLAARLRDIGLSPRIERVPLPNGTVSHNVRATIAGTSPESIVLGAHFDTKSPSPGANDNASGCGVVLEVARLLKARPARPDIEIVFFGAEEMIDSNGDHHHFGSRSLATKLAAAGKKPAGVLVVDMVGVGDELVVRTMGVGPKSLANTMLRRAKSAKIAARYLRDPSAYGWSDHEPFERQGIPVAWLERREDPRYHTARDTASYVSTGYLQQAGVVTLSTIRSLR